MPGGQQTEAAHAHGQAASLAATVPSFSLRKALGVFHPSDWWRRRSLYGARRFHTAEFGRIYGQTRPYVPYVRGSEKRTPV